MKSNKSICLINFYGEKSELLLVLEELSNHPDIVFSNIHYSNINDNKEEITKYIITRFKAISTHRSYFLYNFSIQDIFQKMEGQAMWNFTIRMSTIQAPIRNMTSSTTKKRTIRLNLISYNEIELINFLACLTSYYKVTIKLQELNTRDSIFKRYTFQNGDSNLICNTTSHLFFKFLNKDPMYYENWIHDKEDIIEFINLLTNEELKEVLEELISRWYYFLSEKDFFLTINRYISSFYKEIDRRKNYE